MRSVKRYFLDIKFPHGPHKNRGLIFVTRDRNFERIEDIKVELYG